MRRPTVLAVLAPLALALVATAGGAASASPAPLLVAAPSAAPGATLTSLKGAAPEAGAVRARARRGVVAPAPKRLGLTLDAGVPDGANLAVVLRPWRPVRLHAGGGYNGISRGVRAGVTLIPRRGWFSPSMSVDAGRYVEGDANGLARMVTGDPTFADPMLEKVGYTYTNAHLGFEMGREHVTFYVHAGYSWMSGNLRNTGVDTVGTVVTVNEDPTVSVWSVSARIGLVVYVR